MSEPDLQQLSHDELVKLVLELVKENERLRKELDELKRKKHRSATPFSKGTRKGKPKNPGRKPGQGSFHRRTAPEIKPDDRVNHSEARLPEDFNGSCPLCGGQLSVKKEEVTTTDIAESTGRDIQLWLVPVAECQCGYRQRGTHPDLPNDQHGATAHRVGARVTALGLALHYHYGVTMRKVPAILEEVCGIPLSQSALTQESLKLGSGEGLVKQEAEKIKEVLQKADYVHTDDTGWKTGGKQSYLMGFGSRQERAVYYQIRGKHGAREVAEVITEIFIGVLNTDRFKSYDAGIFRLIAMQKCLSHILKNLSEVLETKSGRSRWFCLELQALFREGLALWHKRRDEQITAKEYEAEGMRLMKKLEEHLRPRELKDADNQRMLNELGWQFDRGNLTTFLEDEEVEPTNNFAERFLRPAVIARKVSQCSKTEKGAETYASFKSVLGTFALRGVRSIASALANLIAPPSVVRSA